MKKLSYHRELKEVPFTIKNLSESLYKLGIKYMILLNL